MLALSATIIKTPTEGKSFGRMMSISSEICRICTNVHCSCSGRLGILHHLTIMAFSLICHQCVQVACTLSSTLPYFTTSTLSDQRTTVHNKTSPTCLCTIFHFLKSFDVSSHVSCALQHNVEVLVLNVAWRDAALAKMHLKK